MKNNEIDIINRLIDKAVVGVDTYNHNGSRWLIFTNSKKWVIELTKEGTLWYNYYFFQNIFKLLSLDLVENQNYITKWVEDNIISKVNHTKSEYYREIQKVEYTIQNGVKDTSLITNLNNLFVEDTIQNGVKETRRTIHPQFDSVEDTIQNGIKDTQDGYSLHEYKTEEVIQNGVKETKNRLQRDFRVVEDTIQNGVKETLPTIHPQFHSVEDAIQNGVKHTEYGDWEDGDERFDDIIQNGVKETNMDEHHRLREVVQTVKNGIKETESIASHRTWKSEEVIQNGIKETIPVVPGDIEDTIDFMSYNGTTNVPHLISDVIEKGVKETHADVIPHTAIVESVIKNGIKKTEGGVLFDESKLDDIVKPENKIN